MNSLKKATDGANALGSTIGGGGYINSSVDTT